MENISDLVKMYSDSAPVPVNVMIGREYKPFTLTVASPDATKAEYIREKSLEVSRDIVKTGLKSSQTKGKAAAEEATTLKGMDYEGLALSIIRELQQTCFRDEKGNELPDGFLTFLNENARPEDLRRATRSAFYRCKAQETVVEAMLTVRFPGLSGDLTQVFAADKTPLESRTN